MQQRAIYAETSGRTIIAAEGQQKGAVRDSGLGRLAGGEAASLGCCSPESGRQSAGGL